nr:Arm DNA-binding domain-containing protein [Bartonella sp. ML69XJBT]
MGAGKVNDGAGLLLHKRKDGGAQWLYRYTIHGRRREMGLGALRDVSLKQACECANQWRSVLREGRAPIKEREKQRRVGGCCCGTSWHKFCVGLRFCRRLSDILSSFLPVFKKDL